VDQNLLDYFRVPPALFADIATTDGCAFGDSGFFQFGTNNICYGRCQAGVAAKVGDSAAFDASKHVHRKGGTIQLPFDFAEVIENLRFERYRPKTKTGREAFASNEAVQNLYYQVRGFLPFSIRRGLQRIYFRDASKLPFPAWPVDFTVEDIHEMLLRLLMEGSGLKRVPFIWFWPEGAPNCVVITHDVETSEGRDFTSRLMDLDDSRGFKASFQVIPEQRYDVTSDYVSEIRSRGFELNAHDINHDGRLYLERQEFLRRAARINAFVREYGCRGFRAGSMFRNLEWYDAFDFSYDMSVPNVAHLDPMRGGCCTAIPYFVGKIVELPVTTAQDYTVFHMLNDYSIELWKQQLELIRGRNGLISILTHPDYLIEKRAYRIYASLLDYIRQKVDREQIWSALPGDVDRWWRARSEMKLTRRGDGWEIVGPDKERARLAFAVLDGDRLVYEVEKTPSRETAFREYQ
jgi:hypothetical protein